MIIFAIPLRGKKTTNNWKQCVANFNSTLESIFNQKNSDDFKCIVACNEIPTLRRQYDSRLEFISMDLPTPTEWIEMARDKFWKLTRIAVRCREILDTMDNPENGIYIMPVDADDLLSNRIAEYCEMNPYENGFFSKEGYVKYANENKLHVYKDLHTFCGSCNIIKMYKDDLPKVMPYPDNLCHDKTVAGILNERYPIRFDHNIIVDRYASEGKAFAILPFRSTIYCLGNGDNISSLYHKEHKSGKEKAFHPVAFIRKVFEIRNWRIITKELKREYMIP